MSDPELEKAALRAALAAAEAEREALKAKLENKSGAFEHACRMQRKAQDALSMLLQRNEPDYMRALHAEARAERMAEALKALAAEHRKQASAWSDGGDSEQSRYHRRLAEIAEAALAAEPKKEDKP